MKRERKKDNRNFGLCNTNKTIPCVTTPAFHTYLGKIICVVPRTETHIPFWATKSDCMMKTGTPPSKASAEFLAYSSTNKQSTIDS